MDASPEFDIGSIPDFDRELNRPSPLFLQVAQEIGERIGLSTDKIVAGTPVDFEGISFWLAHHGQRDPDAMVLLIHMGDIPDELESIVFRRMLEHNAMTPAAVGGYYSLLPGTNTAAFCLRLNLAKSPSPCDAILGYVAIFAKQVEAFQRLADSGLQIVQQHMHGASAAGQAEAH